MKIKTDRQEARELIELDKENADCYLETIYAENFIEYGDVDFFEIIERFLLLDIFLTVEEIAEREL